MADDRPQAQALLAVFPDQDRATEVTESLVRAGVDRDRIRVGAAIDETASLEAEVREESTRSLIAPAAGVVYPKETVKAGVAFGGPLTAIGTVIGAVAGALAPIDGWPLWLRALLGAIVGATAFGTIAAVAVPAMSVRNPLDPSVAETGTTVRVGDASARVERLLVEARPLRLDRLGEDDAPMRTVVTEEDFRDGGIVEEVADNFAREHQADPEHKTR